MKISHIDQGGKRTPAALPYDGADHVVVERACPNGECRDTPMKVRARESLTNHDIIVGVAFCLCCKRAVGTLEVKVSTIFGVEEDRRVLNGRVRVY